MTPAARVQTAAELLDAVLAGQAAEQALTRWARASRYAGSKDRAAVRDLVFEALRRKRSLACLGGAETGRGLMLGLLCANGDDPEAVFIGGAYGPAPLEPGELAAGAAPESEGARLDMPDWLLPHLRASLGDALEDVAEALRHRAPAFLRVNSKKTDRAGAISVLAEDGIHTTLHPTVETALLVTDGSRRLTNARAYRDGLVELQDASSQAAVLGLALKDGDRVLDYCAGGGGKTLAMAGRAGARFFAHDAMPERMRDLAPRAARAGVEVRQLERADLQGFAPFDLVLCDVPCSGSGTWRRAPEAKWRLTPDDLRGLNDTQDKILDAAASLVAPDGVLAYATCSILDQENEDRVKAFLHRFPDWRVLSRQRWLPNAQGDGFFIAQLTRNNVT